jgi:hypothetical protein
VASKFSCWPKTDKVPRKRTNVRAIFIPYIFLLKVFIINCMHAVCCSGTVKKFLLPQFM